MTEPSPHLDLDGLADHLAGETSPHVASCEGCSARLAELEAAEREVVASLRALPPVPVPEDVAARLSAAFAAERPLAASTTVTPIASAPSRRDRRTWAPGIAAALLLAFGGLAGYAVISGSSGSDDSATDAAAAPASGSAEARLAFPTVASGLDYADAPAVASGLPSVLSGSAGNAPTAALDAPPNPAGAVQADPLARLRDPAALADCLSALLDPSKPDELPLALDYAAYQGNPALAVVLPDADPAKVSVFVVGPDCSRADDDLQFFTRLDRP